MRKHVKPTVDWEVEMVVTPLTPGAHAVFVHAQEDGTVIRDVVEVDLSDQVLTVISRDEEGEPIMEEDGFKEVQVRTPFYLRHDDGRERWPEHDLFRSGDEGIPSSVKDRNGDVVLGLCKRCHRAEALLDGPCLSLVE